MVAAGGAGGGGSSRSAKKRATRKQHRAAGMDCSNLLELDDTWADAGPRVFSTSVGGEASASAAAVAGPSGSQSSSSTCKQQGVDGKATRCLTAKTSRECSPRRDADGVPATAAADDFVPSFASGAQVILTGLVSRPDLRGARAEIVFFDPAAGRYAVRLEAGEEIKIVESNLRASIFGQPETSVPGSPT